MKQTLLNGGLQVVRDKIVTNCIEEDANLLNYAVKYKTEKVFDGNEIFGIFNNI